MLQSSRIGKQHCKVARNSTINLTPKLMVQQILPSASWRVFVRLPNKKFRKGGPMQLFDELIDASFIVTLFQACILSPVGYISVFLVPGLWKSF